MNQLVLAFAACIGCYIPEAWSLSSPQQLTTRTIIQVCQNKDCCRRYKGSLDLVQTMHVLVPPSQRETGMASGTGEEFVVKATSCLSHCDKGPNIVFRKLNGKKEISSKTVNGVEDVTMAAVQLELATGQPPLSILLAAARVMDKTSKGTRLLNERSGRFM